MSHSTQAIIQRLIDSVICDHLISRDLYFELGYYKDDLVGNSVNQGKVFSEWFIKI